MSLFPLYDELLETARKSSQAIDLRKICSTINNLPDEHILIVFLLILHHELTENKGTRFKAIPYNGQLFSAGRGVMYTMMNLPPFLQRIIACYINRIV